MDLQVAPRPSARIRFMKMPATTLAATMQSELLRLSSLFENSVTEASKAKNRPEVGAKGCPTGSTLRRFFMVKIVRRIPLQDEGNDVAYWRSRPPVERLRALDSLRRLYIKAYVAPGKQRFSRVYRIVKLGEIGRAHV